MGEHQLKQKYEFAEGMVAKEYIAWFDNAVSSNLKKKSFAKRYLPVIKANKVAEKQNSVFISVIMRTQGKRPEALREVMLCLFSQSDQDFEVILIGHKLDKKQNEVVSQILEELEPQFRKKVRFIRVETGTRTVPLNVGFANAYGEYAVVLDDDDLVMEEWVERFHLAAEENPGKLLHCYAVGQDWKAIDVDSSTTVLQSAGKVEHNYCCNFDFFTEINYNRCPLMTIAFPLKYFQCYGFIFDESLTTVEDWDYVVRIAFLTGVIDIPYVGAIYRYWENYGDSHTVEANEKWKENEKYVRNKFNSIPALFLVSELRNLHSGNGAVSSIMLDDKLYWDYGKGFSESNSKIQENPQPFGIFSLTYERINAEGEITRLRWDPSWKGKLIIRGLVASVRDKEGNEFVFGGKETGTNGVLYHDGVLFLDDDPQFWFDIPKGFKVESFSVRGEASRNMTIDENKRILKIAIIAKRILRKLHLRKIEG